MRRGLVSGLALQHATDLSNLSISCLQVWIRDHTYSILASNDALSVWLCVMVEDILAILHVHPLTN
jgi:hypothetical protein